jgi:hypothetical protein
MTGEQEDRLTGRERRHDTAEHLAEDLGVPESEGPDIGETNRDEASLPVRGR